MICTVRPTPVHNVRYEVWGTEFRANGLMPMLRSIYTGYIPCLGRQVGNQATAFTAFYSGKQRYLEWSGQEELSIYQRLVGGFLACRSWPRLGPPSMLSHAVCRPLLIRVAHVSAPRRSGRNGGVWWWTYRTLWFR